MARSTFYYHLSRLSITGKEQQIRDAITRIYHLHKGRYGILRITSTLRSEGVMVNHKRVERIMKELGLKSLVRPKKYRSYRGIEGRIASNIIKRDFVAQSVNQKWATDVTEFKICGNKLYLSPVLDMYNGEIISYTLCKHPNLLMVTSMMRKALKKVNNTDNLIIHSDQGWHYQNRSYQKMLENKNITQSMSRKGNCLDNAMMESFFAVFKSELIYLQKFNSINEFERSLKSYIKYYNNDRIKLSLKGMSPVKYRTHSINNI